MGISLPVSLTAYSVVGAAAYMGGATRMTLTTTVMVMETTGALQLIVPIMLTVFVAKVPPPAACRDCIALVASFPGRDAKRFPLCSAAAVLPRLKCGHAYSSC